MIQTDGNGLFTIATAGDRIMVRAPGYLRAEQTLLVPYADDHLLLRLTPFTPKALYLTGYGTASRPLREAALRLQAFRDYAFVRRSMAGQPLRDQIAATEAFGANGWMLWNPSNVYPRDGLPP